MALAVVEQLRFSYGHGAPALDGVTLRIEDGEHVALLGPSGCGKSTLLRALAGLVPHFHGGTFAGRVVVAGLDTRETQPAQLVGPVASVFQDPEDQVVMARVANEVAFGLENVGTAPTEIWQRVEDALALVGAEHLAGRQVAELSGGELQRVCLASALALEPRLLLLDEPTSQLDPDGADAFFDLVERLDCAVLVSEQRPARPLARADRVLFMEAGRVLLDAPRDDAIAWLAAHRPLYLPHRADTVCSLHGIHFAYGENVVLDGASLEVRRGEIVALTGPNGAGKTTLAKIASGLLEPADGEVSHARAAFLTQDPGRHLVTERVLDEVALGSDDARARVALAQLGLTAHADRHPRDLSAGERERLALAAVLALEPELLVLDEPTRGVDPERKSELAALLPLAGSDARHAPRHRTTCRGRPRSPTASSSSTFGRACVRRLFVVAARAARRLARRARRRTRDTARRRGARRRRRRRGSSREPTRRASSRSSPRSRAAAAAGRVVFAAVPGVQPVTVIAVVAGAALGLRAGVADGSARSVRLEPLPRPGDLDAAADARLGRLRRGRRAARAGAPFALDRSLRVCFVLGIAFSASMDVWLWYGFFPHTWTAFTAVIGRGLWFDVAHGVGNVVIALAAGPELRRMLDRYGTRLRTVVVWV